MYIPIWQTLKKPSNKPLHKVKSYFIVPQNVVVFFNKDMIIIKPLMIARNAFWKTVEVALQKLLVFLGVFVALFHY